MLQRLVDPPSDDLHAAMAKLIRADFGEVIWRDRDRLGPIAPTVSPATGHTHLHDAVTARKLSAAKWLVRLGGRVREPHDGTADCACPWDAALRLPDPVPMLLVLLTSDSLTAAQLAQCADDLLAIHRSATTQRADAAAYDAYCTVCRRINRQPRPPRTPHPAHPVHTVPPDPS